MPYGDKKSYSFFKMKYQGNNSAFPFKSPIKKGTSPHTPAKPLPEENLTQELLNINIKEASKKKTIKQKRKEDCDLN